MNFPWEKPHTPDANLFALADLNPPPHEPPMPLDELHQVHDRWSAYGFKPIAVWGAYSNPPPNADGRPKKPGKTPKRAGFTSGDTAAERAALAEGDNIGVLGGAPLNGGSLCFCDLDFDDEPAYDAAVLVPSLKGRPVRITGKAGRGVIPFPVPKGTPYKKLEWKRATDGCIIAMELRSTSGHQTVVDGVHPETKLRIQWHRWSEPSTWSVVDPFTLWSEISAALAPLGWKPTRTFAATDFKAKPQRQAAPVMGSTAAGRAQFDVSAITDAEWKHLDRWFRELVTNRVTVESAQAVTAGQGGDWFRDNFLPGGLLGRKPGYNVDSWVGWAADIASQAGRDVEHAKRSVRNALTTIEITTDNLGLKELENYRKRFAGTVSDEEAIAVVNAAAPNAIVEAQKWAQDRLNAFLQESASDYWFVKMHIARDGDLEAVSGHEYLAEVARPLAPLVRAGKVDGESIVGACVTFASERHAETVEGGGSAKAWRSDLAERAVRGALYHDPITTTPYTTKAGCASTEYFPAGDYVLTVLRGMTPEANGTRPGGCSDNFGFYEPEGVAGFKVKTPGEDWPAMEPLRADALPVPKFKEEHLPESLRPWAVDIAYRMRVALDVVAPLVIAALGIAIGARIALRPRAGDYTWSEVANLWMALVSRAGTLKTPVQNAVFAPLRAIAAKYEEEHRLAMDAFNTEHEKWEVEKSKLKETLRKGSAPLSDLDEINSREPAPPVKRRLLAEKAGSAVRLAKVMRDNPNGLGLVLDELAPTLRKVSVEREDGDDLREILIKSWGGLTPHLYESEAQGEVFIPRACLSVVGSIQPGPFSEFIASAVAAGDDGLVQRFSIMVWPDPVRLARPEGKPHADARKRADEVFRALIGMDPRATGAKQGEFDKVPHLEFDPEAQKIFEAWEDTNITKAQDEGGALGTHLDKYKTLTCGLAMLRELIDWASAPLSPPEPGVPWHHRKPMVGVGVGATKAAVELAGFFEAHARRAYGLSDASAVAARALATKVRDGEVTDGMTLRKLQRKKWPGLRLAHEVRDAVEMLQDLGWLKLEQKPSATPGRPTIIIKLHPDHKNGAIEELPAAPTG